MALSLCNFCGIYDEFGEVDKGLEMLEKGWRSRVASTVGRMKILLPVLC